ncbi:hypothetical protein GCM10010174_38010 [Kutzneria viridogrisea]
MPARRRPLPGAPSPMGRVRVAQSRAVFSAHGCQASRLGVGAMVLASKDFPFVARSSLAAESPLG